MRRCQKHGAVRIPKCRVQWVEKEQKVGKKVQKTGKDKP